MKLTGIGHYSSDMALPLAYRSGSLGAPPVNSSSPQLKSSGGPQDPREYVNRAREEIEMLLGKPVPPEGEKQVIEASGRFLKTVHPSWYELGGKVANQANPIVFENLQNRLNQTTAFRKGVAIGAAVAVLTAVGISWLITRSMVK
jgi:hypothetical protein